MHIYTEHYHGNRALQGESLPGRDQIKTSDGAFAFAADEWQRLDRFLILGTEKGSYYANEKKLTRKNAALVESLLAKDGLRVVKAAADISFLGRAPKNDTSLFVLAMAVALGDLRTRQYAYSALPHVARIPTHLFTFLDMCKALGRGWGRSYKRAIAEWYRNNEKLDYHLVKYKQRNGWSNRDVLRLAHPMPKNEKQSQLFKWAVGKNARLSSLPDIVKAAILAQSERDIPTLCKHITEHNLPREAIPTEHLNNTEIWEALLSDMPMTALIRNLGKISSLGMLAPMSEIGKDICKKLTDQERIHKARVHPIAVLKALMTYRKGRGQRGSLSWTPNHDVVDALDEAFHLAFINARPIGNNVLFCLDVSASMSWTGPAGLEGVTCREAAAAMMLVSARTEPSCHIMAFCHHPSEVTFTKKARLTNVVEETEGLPHGATDVSLPFLYALHEKLPIDTFVVYTDNETNCRYAPQPVVALRKYRKRSGREARLIVVGMVANELTIADPYDEGMLDVVGFDTAAPDIIAAFARGEI